MNIAAVYATRRPTADKYVRLLEWTMHEGEKERGEENALVAPFHEACVMALCSSPAAWMPFMRTPHMPSWPTTSYRGERRTKNSSVAFAVCVGEIKN